jgi:subtilisin family serine protease
MLKRRVISVGVMLTLAAEIILGPITACGAQFPLKKKSVNTTAISQSSVYDPQNDPIRKALENSEAKKTEAIPTKLSNVTQASRNFTNVASASTKNNNAQYGSLSLTDLQKVNRSNDKEIIVKYKNVNQRENTKKKLSTKKSKLSFKSKHWSKKFKLETIEVSDDGELTNVINELKKDPNVEYAQPNYKLELMNEPSDDRYIDQWSLNNSGQVVSGQAGTVGMDINILNAWNITKGSDSVKVAIIDTGVDINNFDLATSIYRNPNDNINGLDDDGNGYVDDVNGWNFVSDTNNVFTSETEDTHGTHIAGIISAAINNGGVVGVSPSVKIVPLKFISGNTGFTSDAIRAIEYCQKAGIEIANVSWGGSDYNPALLEAMKNSSITFVCAVGNAGKNINTNAVYPAAFDLPNIITVTANDNKGQLAPFSNYGTKVCLSAPGVDILSTLPGNKYGYLSGTSMAAPFVAGTAALLKSIDSTLSAAEIKDRILNNTTKSANLSGKVSTSGRLNAYAALINKVPESEGIPLPTQIPTNKSKEPQSIYDRSLAGNGKTEKPLKGKSNLFVDALINKGISNTSNENGIENLSINKMKGDFVSITWTTDFESDSVLFYGDTSSLEKKISYPELTTKHQIILKLDNIDSLRFYKVCSNSKDGRVFESGVKEAASINDLGGEAIKRPASTETVSASTSQEISTFSYVMDNGSNHSLVTAQSIGECTVFGTANGTRHDYYSVNLTEGKTYSIKLTGMAAGEDYDIYLMDNVLMDVGYSTNISNYDESISYTATATATYYIDIQPSAYNTNSAHHNYQLMLYSTENTPDSYEPNDSMNTATAISDSIPINPTLNLNIDEDWFVLDTTKTGKLAATMKSIPSGCDYDMQVYDANGILLGGSYTGGNQDEKFDSMITTPGKYYLCVYSYIGSSSTDTYELKAGVYTPDQYEINDDIYSILNSEPSISIGDCFSATLDNTDDVDCFKFNINSSTNVGVRLQNIPSDMDYDMVVYSYSSGNGFVEVARSTYKSNSDEAIISQFEAGSYYIKIYSYSGSSETQSYKLSVTDENAGIVKMDFDKTYAEVGDIITATLKVDRITNFAGYQVNIKYDPEVVQPVDDDSQLYCSDTMPTGATLLNNSNYSPISFASNDLNRGVMSFGTSYVNQISYKQNGIAETSGILAAIKFKVLKSNQVQIKFVVSDSMPNSNTGVYLFDWDFSKINGGFNVQQPQIVNSSLTANLQSVESSYANDIVSITKESEITTYSGYKISGYVKGNINNNNKYGFLVKSIDSTISHPLQCYTNETGAYTITDIPGPTNQIYLRKNGYIGRDMNISLTKDRIIGKSNAPIKMWGGDVNADDATNMYDVIEIAKHFGGTSGSSDLTNDGIINMNDAIAVAASFNRTKSQYVPYNYAMEYLDGFVSDSVFTNYLYNIGTLSTPTYKSGLYTNRDYQRYDKIINGWVAYFNEVYGWQIDQKVIKAMVYIESKMGYQPSNSPNENITLDVMQCLDPRNAAVYDFSNINSNSGNSIYVYDANKNYVLLSSLGFHPSAPSGLTVYDVAKRLFLADGNFYRYQYNQASPMLSIGLGVYYYGLKLEQTGNKYEAAKAYNGGGDPNYKSKVQAICEGANIDNY